MDAANIQALVQALMAAATAAAANAGPAPQVPLAPPNVPLPPDFALLPGLATADPLDFNKGADNKIFHRAIQGLDTKFDLKESNLRVFLESVKERARIYNWKNILTIPIATAGGTTRDIITNYGQFNVTDIQTHASTYIVAETRNVQNSMIMYQFISNSLTDSAKLNLLSNPALYTVRDLPSGPLFLKIIIGKASIDTPARILLLRTSIANLHVKMTELKGNVRDFHTYVEQQCDALTGRGQVVDELIMHLFTAYETVTDARFARYIDGYRNEFEDGRRPLDAEGLMRLACQKYDLITQSDATKSTSETDGKVIALPTQVHPRPNDADFAWKKIPPRKGESHTKRHGKKKYHWCPHHQMWTIHSGEQCKLDTSKQTTDNDQEHKANKKEK